jgi:hypothetical protein
MRRLFEQAMTYETFLEGVREQREFWFAMTKRATVPEELCERALALRQPRRLLVLLEDWCGDAINSVPYIVRLAEAAPQLDLRVLRRDEHPELMDRHLTGASRSIPVVIVLDERYNECGWWGPRPGALQQWVRAEGSALEKSERYLEIRRRYALDRGRSILGELLDLLSRGCSAKAA